MNTTLSGAAEAVRLPIVVGAARPLGPNDIAAAAAALGVEEAAYRAVLIVETGGRSAYRPDGRMPILFEAHIAYRLNGGVTVPGLAERSWDRGLYSSTAAGEYDRLTRACQHRAIGPAVALKAASWGMPQILGSNHALCGFGDVESFVRAMADSAVAQLAAFNSFVTARGLLPALRSKRWSDFARGYNGTAFAANAYDEKLAGAYQRVRGAAGDGALGIGDVGPDVAALQRALQRCGFPVIVEDGDFGRRTANAVEQVQAVYRLPVTGRVDTRTAIALGLV
ncbi:putative peptidoglycan binding protein [Azospirillum brasilense]|uniref:Putative peptidoglycan binding protein n=1 Tax=Azospirillum brasilense TaxID=192 RepID=A0A560BW76_AZOBR|nr:N-acetylmuramidase domain-containing protein [Azospirillum brasilense]TWA76865.1 putative peptidoglycan binding protein [Azospirillum brasilense]